MHAENVAVDHWVTSLEMTSFCMTSLYHNIDYTNQLLDNFSILSENFDTLCWDMSEIFDHLHYLLTDPRITWNKWLVFRNHLLWDWTTYYNDPARLALFVYRAYYMTLFNTSALHAGLWSSGMTLASHREHDWFETYTILCNIGYFFIAYSVLYFLLSFSHSGLYIHFPFTLTFSYKLLFSI